jgi:molecular chaperone GrpE
MKVQTKFKSKKEETNEFKNQLARALADYDNLRKRVERERQDLETLSSFRIILKLLPILDNLRAALIHLKDPGLAIALKDFEEVLKSEGIEEIRVEIGADFNHNLHEVVEVAPGGRKGKIAGIVLSGWKYVDGPVIRHAKVKVYGEKSKKEEELEKEVSRGDYV